MSCNSSRPTCILASQKINAIAASLLQKGLG
jgi:hypothetical protein